MDMELAGKRVMITGASGGIGQQMVKSFVAEQAEVVAHYFRNSESAGRLKTDLGVEIAQADLSKSDDVAAMFAKLASRPIDCLVANAGIWPHEDRTLDEIEFSRWENTMAANLTATFLSVQHFLKNVRRHQLSAPSIVMVASTAGHFGEAGHGDYAAAKAAIAGGLLPSLKNEIVRVARFGRANCISPGWTMTPMAEKFADDQTAMARARQTIALRKFGTPLDMANAAVFLCSPRAGHISGQVLSVHGGMEGRVLFEPQDTQ